MHVSHRDTRNAMKRRKPVAIAIRTRKRQQDAGKHQDFNFDETLATVYKRSAQLGADLRPHQESGKVRITQLAPAEISPRQFSVRPWGKMVPASSPLTASTVSSTPHVR
jgi:hypothetical protein